MSAAERDREHRSGSQPLRCLPVDSWIYIRIVTPHALSGSQTQSRKPCGRVELHTDVWRDRTRCRAADNVAFLDQGDRNTVGTGQCESAFRNQLQNFEEQEFISSAAALSGTVAGGFACSLSNSFMKSGEGEQRLQSIAPRGRDIARTTLRNYRGGDCRLQFRGEADFCLARASGHESRYSTSL